MPLPIADPAIIDLVLRFALNAAAMAVLVFGMYYRRHRDKELVIAAAMFNSFTFAVLTILSSVDFGLAAGFGLFAIFSALFSLRSEPLGRTEIAYFFGSVSIAVICSIQGTDILFVLAIVTLLLISAYIIDHPRVLRSVSSIKITLDRIDPDALSHAPAMQAELSRRFGVDVLSYQVTGLDYVNDTARITVSYRTLDPARSTK